MILKSVLAVITCFAFSLTKTSEDPVCKKGDREWEMLTKGAPVPASSHLLIDKTGRIVRRDILEKQQLWAYRYLPKWKAYEEVAQSNDNHILTTQRTPRPFTDSSQSQESETTGISADESNQLEIILKLFHWHLAADELQEPKLPERMITLSNKIVDHLNDSRLLPNVFVFTGAHALTAFRGSLLNHSYAESLCRKLWQHQFGKQPEPEQCKLPVQQSLPNKKLIHSNISRSNNILVISMVPISRFNLKFFGQYCTLSGTWQGMYAAFQIFDIEIDQSIVPIMVFSSLDEAVVELVPDRSYWEGCSSGIKEEADRAIKRTEPLVIVSHINTPGFTYSDFAQIWSARIRPAGDNSKEVNLNNPAAKGFFKRYIYTDTKARRFSAVLSYRKTLQEKPMPQPTRAHMAPDSIYLEFPGTKQNFLKWKGGYSPFYPSYTEIRLEKKHLTCEY